MTEQKKTQSVWKSYRFPILLISSIIIGSIIGLVMGEKATVLKPFGDIFLNLMFTAIVPLVFATIASAIGNMLNMKRLGKILGSLLAVFVVTGLIAGVIIIFIVTIYPPAAGVHITMEAAGDMEAVKLSDAIVNALTVSDFSALLSRQNMLPLIIFSIMFGFCISACGGKESAVGQVVNNLADIMMKIVNIIMVYAPIGLGAYFANLVGEFGPNLLGAYGRAMLVYYPVCAAYFVIFFSLYAYWAAGKDVEIHTSSCGNLHCHPEFGCNIAGKPGCCQEYRRAQGYKGNRASAGSHHAHGRNYFFHIAENSVPVRHFWKAIYRNRDICICHAHCHHVGRCHVGRARRRIDWGNADCKPVWFSGRSIPNHRNYRVPG